jgi:hypothetical protein
MIDGEARQRQSPNDRVGHELVIFDQQYAHETRRARHYRPVSRAAAEITRQLRH